LDGVGVINKGKSAEADHFSAQGLAEKATDICDSKHVQNWC
jgi:hypothetical protein